MEAPTDQPVLLTETLTPDSGGQILQICFNRPKTMNALSQELVNEFEALVRKTHGDWNIRALIITGAGRAFCAGADLKERATMSEDEVRKFLTQLGALLSSLEQLHCPVIAAMNGYALGGGLELALACDFRLAAGDARLGLTETSLGIIPGAGGTQRLSRLIGPGRAKELIFTARKIDAQTAYELGLVHQVCADALLDVARKLAFEIAANAPIAVAAAKEAIQNGNDLELARGLELERRAYEKTIHTRDRLEALQAFKEKRKPMFKGE